LRLIYFRFILRAPLSTGFMTSSCLLSLPSYDLFGEYVLAKWPMWISKKHGKLLELILT